MIHEVPIQEKESKLPERREVTGKAKDYQPPLIMSTSIPCPRKLKILMPTLFPSFT